MMQYNKASWLSLAQSTLEADRKYALEMALVNAENFQEELLFWSFQQDIILAIKFQIYNVLLEETKQLFYKEEDPQPSHFVIGEHTFSEEKSGWIKLAKSLDQMNRSLALTLLEGQANDYQPEILHWLKVKHPLLIEFKLYSLLTPENKALFTKQQHTEIIPAALWNDGSFEIYISSTDSILKQSILLSIFYKGIPLTYHKINFVKNYRTIASCSLREAKEAADELWDDPRWQKNQ